MAGAYQTGIYRNVLKECGYEETAITERLEQTFDTIFYGTEAERFYHEAGGDMAYLEDTGNHDVRTEGMSYGMMVAYSWIRKRNLTVSGSGCGLICIFRQDPAATILPGPAARMERTMQRDRHRTEKSILPWHCFSPPPAGGRRRYFCLQQRGKSNPAGMYPQRGAWTSGRTYVGAFQSSDQICHKHGFF